MSAKLLKLLLNVGRFLALTSVSKKRRKALFFLMLFRRKKIANPSATITTTNIPPITPAAIRGVLEENSSVKIKKF